MHASNRDKVIDTFRNAVLAALDAAAIECFGNTLGASDGDLPDLFRTLDLHVEKLATRYGAALVD